MSIFDGVKKSVFFLSNPDWYDVDEEAELPYLTEKAPPEAVESYEYWKKEYEKSAHTSIIYN